MTRVKICGITNLEDALIAIEYGADALGFIFAPSPRQMKISVVRDIVAHLPPFISKVGVFVNSELSLVRETVSACSLSIVQLHGNEDAAYCSALFPNVIKVFTKSNIPSNQDIVRYMVTAYMIDQEKSSAGDDIEQRELWQLARNLKEHGPVILAGGLTPDNVAEAVEAARPYAVDVSSGIESAPGKKDVKKLREFIEAAKRSK